MLFSLDETNTLLRDYMIFFLRQIWKHFTVTGYLNCSNLFVDQV